MLGSTVVPNVVIFFAVDDDAPLDDQGLGLTPGCHPGLRNDLV
jgi:hypothetical protein